MAAAQAAEAEVRLKLAAGTLLDGLGPVQNPVTVGIGQSMGGAFTIVQQGRHHCYDGVGVLGFSPLHTQPPTRPGTPPLALPWVPRDTLPSEGDLHQRTGSGRPRRRCDRSAPSDDNVMAWGFHFDDVDPAVVQRDMDDYPARHGDLPPWASATIPGTAVLWSLAPGSILAEAAAIRCPVLVALGERDVVVDPRGELRAFASSASVDFFECPRMAHMHNFAGTRELFWQRIETWAGWVRALRNSQL